MVTNAVNRVRLAPIDRSLSGRLSNAAGKGTAETSREIDRIWGTLAEAGRTGDAEGFVTLAHWIRVKCTNAGRGGNSALFPLGVTSGYCVSR
jgi:hypothetical protein